MKAKQRECQFKNWIKYKLALAKTKNSIHNYVVTTFEKFATNLQQIDCSDKCSQHNRHTCVYQIKTNHGKQLIETKCHLNTFLFNEILRINDNNGVQHLEWSNSNLHDCQYSGWAICKLFLPRGYRKCDGPEEVLSVALFHVINRCVLFHPVDHHTVEEIICTCNWISYLPDQMISCKKMDAIFKLLIKFLKFDNWGNGGHTCLKNRRECKDAVKAIKKLRHDAENSTSKAHLDSAAGNKPLSKHMHPELSTNCDEEEGYDSLSDDDDDDDDYDDDDDDDNGGALDSQNKYNEPHDKVFQDDAWLKGADGVSKSPSRQKQHTVTYSDRENKGETELLKAVNEQQFEKYESAGDMSSQELRTLTFINERKEHHLCSENMVRGEQNILQMADNNEQETPICSVDHDDLQNKQSTEDESESTTQKPQTQENDSSNDAHVKQPRDEDHVTNILSDQDEDKYQMTNFKTEGDMSSRELSSLPLINEMKEHHLDSENMEHGEQNILQMPDNNEQETPKCSADHNELQNKQSTEDEPESTTQKPQTQENDSSNDAHVKQPRDEYHVTNILSNQDEGKYQMTNFKNEGDMLSHELGSLPLINERKEHHLDSDNMESGEQNILQMPDNNEQETPICSADHNELQNKQSTEDEPESTTQKPQTQENDSSNDAHVNQPSDEDHGRSILSDKDEEKHQMINFNPEEPIVHTKESTEEYFQIGSRFIKFEDINHESLHLMMKAHGRKSQIMQKTCDKICKRILSSNHNFVNVWAAYKATSNEEAISVVFVICIERGSRTDFPLEYPLNTFQTKYREVGSLNNEDKEIIENKKMMKQQMDTDSYEKIHKIIQEEAKDLMSKHKNINIISQCSVKSKGYGKSVQWCLEEKPCIVLFVHLKGYIPITEDAFIQYLGNFPIDVREGSFELYSQEPTDYHDVLKMGLMISSGANEQEIIKDGTLGGFLDQPEDELLFITSAHAVLHDTDMIELMQRNVITLDADIHKIYQPNPTCLHVGHIIKAVYSEGGEGETGVEAVLIKLTDQTRRPLNGNFPGNPSPNEKAEFNDDKPTMYASGKIYTKIESESVLRRITAFKFGYRTGMTKGAFYLSGSSVSRSTLFDKIADYDICLHNQLQLVSSDDQNAFAYPGDSGALVFVAHEDDLSDIRPFGVLSGGNGNRTKYYVTPVWKVLEALVGTGVCFKVFSNCICQGACACNTSQISSNVVNNTLTMQKEPSEIVDNITDEFRKLDIKSNTHTGNEEIARDVNILKQEFVAFKQQYETDKQEMEGKFNAIFDLLLKISKNIPGANK